MSDSHVSAAKELVSSMVSGDAPLELPRFSLDIASKALTIQEPRDIKYGKNITISLYQGCVISPSVDFSQVTFSQPHPRIRASFFVTWDGWLRGLKHNAAAKSITLQIDGFPDQTVKY